MGADIHCVLEKRILPPGYMPGAEQWIGVNAFPYVKAEVFLRGVGESGASIQEGNIHWTPVNRNYELFGQLAGVRRAGPEPRGIPTDVSVLAAHMIARWGEDGHSHSWMTMDEALPIFVQTGQFGDPGEAVLKALREGTAKALEPYMNHFWGMEDEDTLDDFRLIFWFDN